MELDIYQVDAFAEGRFTGNPAAVVPLSEPLPEPVMQAMAAEHNLSETAFLVPTGVPGRYGLRWFTPSVEVDLCGHATLASGYVVLNHLSDLDEVRFETRSGELVVRREPDDLLAMELPTATVSPIAAPEGLSKALGAEPMDVYWGEGKLLAIFPEEADVAGLRPDFPAVAALNAFGVIATAPGSGELDFVSRFFAPAAGINEDPVTGAAHTRLVPYWSARLGKSSLRARQISARGGSLWCRLAEDRVELVGRAVLYMTGRVYLS